MIRGVGPCLALCLAGWACAETIEFRDATRDAVRGRILVEFKQHLFVAVDGESPQFVERGSIARILDEGGVPWVNPAPGTFARSLPGQPRAALTDTTLEVRIVQRGHQVLTGKPGPVFLFEGDRADCEGVARLTLIDGTTLTLGAGSSVRIGAKLELLSGEARLAAGSNGAHISLDAGRTVHVAADGVAIVRSGTAAYLYLERGSGSWTAPALKARLREGQGAELLLLDDGLRLSADPTNAEPVAVEGDGAARELVAGESFTRANAVRGWALRDAEGSVLVRRGAQREASPLELSDRDRVRLSGGDSVRTGVESGVALVRSGTGTVRVAADASLRVAQAFDLERGQVALNLIETVRWTFGPEFADLSGATSVQRVGETWQLEATAGGAAWSAAGARLELASGEHVGLTADSEGWQLEGFGLRLDGEDGWTAELPEFVALGLHTNPQRVELRCVGRRVWQVARGEHVDVRANGSAEFPNGAEVSLVTGGVAQIGSFTTSLAQIDSLTTSVAHVDSQSAGVAHVDSQLLPPRVRLANGKSLVLHGALQLKLGYQTVETSRTRLRHDTLSELSLYSARGQADLAVALRDADRIDLPRGDVRILREPEALRLRVADRTLRVDADAPPVVVIVINARGDWEVQGEGLRMLRYPAGAGGELRVSAGAARWRP